MTKICRATSIRERIEKLVPVYNFNYTEDNLSKWIARRSICTKESFEYSLKVNNITKEDFNIGIKTLNEKDESILSKKAKKSSWFKLTEEILMLEDPFDIEEIKTIDFSYIIRFHLNYFSERIKKYNFNDFVIDNKHPFLIHLAEDLTNIIVKTVVYDLHELKKKIIFAGNSSQERFVYYMKYRFGKQQLVFKFLEDYPVLMRLLANRVNFSIENYKKFCDSIEESLLDFQEKFKIKPPYQVTELSLGAGDSHSKGKTVILFEINGEKFAFKEKNLIVGTRFNHFLNFISEKTGKKFKTVKRITRDDYTFEEFITQKEVQNEEEIENFYTRFGEYIALTYLLCSNDLHFENLVAHGEYPTLIDIETIIQNENPLEKSDNPFYLLSMKKYMSVLSTALLPMKFQENRIEPLVEGINKGIRMSAFDGREQKLPYKTLGIVHPNTDKVRFEYIEQVLSGANNLPMFNGKEIDGSKYIGNIIEGFKSMSFFFINNKKEVVDKIEELFSNVLVRNVIKSTQKYCDMLNYAYHPKCMVDFSEREKLFENLWSYSYQEKAPIQSEILDMLNNDVPIFFNNTSNRDLIDSDGKRYKNYYSDTAINRVKEKIQSYDLSEYRYQELRLKLAFEVQEEETETFYFGNETNEILNNIVNELWKRARINNKKTLITFEDYTLEASGELDYSMLNSEFYDGLSGIYLFLLYYVQCFENEKALLMKEILERQLFVYPKKANNEISVYHGKYSVLYPLLEKIKLEKKDSDIKFAKKLVEDIKEFSKVKPDWIAGAAGMIKVLINYYTLTKDKFFLNKAIALADAIDIEKIELCGFSHGYSGIIYALYSLYLETKNSNYIYLITSCLDLENEHFELNHWKDLRKEKNTTSQWCHGTVGIGYTRLLLKEHGYKNDKYDSDLNKCVRHVLSSISIESGLCHGEVGRYSFLEQLSKSNSIDYEFIELVNTKKIDILNSILKEITVEAFDNHPKLGLMTGITGIGYELLRTLYKEIPDVLTLEL